MQEQALEFSKCMREHGIDMPDPQFSTDGGGFNVSIGSDGRRTVDDVPLIDFNSDEFKEASEACGQDRVGGFAVSAEAGRRMKRRWLIVGVVAIGAAAVAVTMATRRPTTAARRITRDDRATRDRAGDADRSDRGGEASWHARLWRLEDDRRFRVRAPSPACRSREPCSRQGESPWQVDGHAGPAIFYGDLPLWRTLRSGVDDGADVAQLEQNLTDLGFGTDVVVDDEFDKYTTAAIKAWQDSRGFKKTGIVEPRRRRRRARTRSSRRAAGRRR